MLKTQFTVLGIMSGTSLDGIDFALVEFNKKGNWTFRLLYSKVVPYSSEWKQKLKNGIGLNSIEIDQLDREYTDFLGEQVKGFLSSHTEVEIDFISSHGHTIWHEPEKGITKQIGNLPILSEITQKKVICDFRVQDVALGGSGAPLVPIGDTLLFNDYEAWVNLGGFANITTLNNRNEVLAYDIAAFNLVFNLLAEKLGRKYDEDGKLSSLGTMLPELFDELNALDYYRLLPPKSLGVEWVNQEILPIIEKYATQNSKDVLHTYTHHLVELFIKTLPAKKNILITGGGVYHKFFVSMLQNKYSGTIHIPSKNSIDFKEAIVFAFLGVLRDRNEINCLASVTGAEKNHCSGKIYDLEKRV